MSRRQRLLINWVYYQPIGHAIEAFRFAQAWRNDNPELEIGLAINRRSAVDLAGCVPAIDTVYPVDVDEFTAEATDPPSLRRIPPDWDYLFTDPRHMAPMGSDQLDRCERLFQAHVRARLRNDGWSLPDGFPGTRTAPLALDLPAAARQFAERFAAPAAGPRIGIFFGSGTEPSRTPPMPFWRALIGQLLAAFPGAELTLLGALAGGRSITEGLTRAALDQLLADIPQLRDGFDLGLVNQLAIAERCDLCISPHTGIGFAVQAVGTPWLVIAGSWAFEYWLNGVPLVSILPECPRFPCDPWSPAPARPMLAACRARRQAGAPYLCLDAAALRDKLPAIVAAARELIAGERPYSDYAQRHYAAMIPRLGLRPGDPFVEGWPDALTDAFSFAR